MQIYVEKIARRLHIRHEIIKRQVHCHYCFVFPGSLDNQAEGCDLSWCNFLFFLYLMTVMQLPLVQEQQILWPKKGK